MDNFYSQIPLGFFTMLFSCVDHPIEGIRGFCIAYPESLSLILGSLAGHVLDELASPSKGYQLFIHCYTFMGNKLLKAVLKLKVPDMLKGRYVVRLQPEFSQSLVIEPHDPANFFKPVWALWLYTTDLKADSKRAHTTVYTSFFFVPH